MSVAAQARARAEARAAAEAEAAAEAAQRTPRKAVVRREPKPEVSVPSPVNRRDLGSASPARQRKAYLIAAAAGSVLAQAGVLRRETAGADNAFEGEAARLLVQLQDDRRRLKLLQSTERKIELKRELLPTYAGWCQGVMAGGRGERGPLDEIFTTVLVWTIDVGDFIAALPMAEHVLVYDLAMPPQITRTAATFVVEEIAEAAVRAYDAGGDAAAAFPAAVLPMVQDLIETLDSDIPDPVQAKLHKALGRAIMAGASPDDGDDLKARQAQTLACYLRALELDEKVGVKKDVEKLNRDLGRPTVPGRSEQVSPQAGTPQIPTTGGEGGFQPGPSAGVDPDPSSSAAAGD